MAQRYEISHSRKIKNKNKKQIKTGSTYILNDEEKGKQLGIKKGLLQDMQTHRHRPSLSMKYTGKRRQSVFNLNWIIMLASFYHQGVKNLRARNDLLESHAIVSKTIMTILGIKFGAFIFRQTLQSSSKQYNSQHRSPG